ncbi:hypothetical protein F2Q70_00032205 [Brassica cretica]|uniref:Uncharacterized protein n=1 Tax=Brassica cretica TaxID=69181 RepID=A0A8S9MRY9_BRACR|nr:hypothetical protein F2Q70_00032205 [Brassica cretica]KAF3486091.1 hypothetical protein F2Q69_00056122 [Brassica cretica]
MNVGIQSYEMRIMFAGGDDTVGWVLGCLGEFNKEETSPITHVGIITLCQRVLVG